MKIRELRPDDREKLLEQLRQDVKDSLAKQEKDPWEVLWLDKCDRRLVAVDEQGNFAAIFLVRTYGQDEEGTGFVWLVPCRGMDDNPIGFLRASKDLVRVFLSLDPWRKLVTHVDTDQQSHIDFLTRWNGFKIVESDVEEEGSKRCIHKVAFTRDMLTED